MVLVWGKNAADGFRPLPSPNANSSMNALPRSGSSNFSLTSGPWFPVGNHATITVHTGGTLYLIMNDTSGTFGDNSGSLSVDIAVNPWTHIFDFAQRSGG